MRSVFLICILLISSIFLFSREDILIDFSNLEGTSIDFSAQAGENWSPEEKALMNLDLSIPNWSVRVNSSSYTVQARNKAEILAVKDTLEYPNQNVLGVRVYFPERYANSYALITPPFEIPSYYDNKDNPDGMGTLFIYKGVVRNVGTLKKISVRVLGNNFRYSLYIRIKNNFGDTRDVFVGYLNFIGWRTISWINPHYQWEVDNRNKNRDNVAYYPYEFPYVRLVGILIQRNDAEVTGNFVTMIKEIAIEYEEEFVDLGEPSSRQEGIFKIYKEELMERAIKETRNIDTKIFNEWVERGKMHKVNK